METKMDRSLEQISIYKKVIIMNRKLLSISLIITYWKSLVLTKSLKLKIPETLGSNEYLSMIGQILVCFEETDLFIYKSFSIFKIVQEKTFNYRLYIKLNEEIELGERV